LAAHVRAPYFLTAAVVPAMIAKGSGSIINVSTMAARIGMAGLSTYSATKAAPRGRIRQGGLLMTQIHRNVRPLEVALDAMLDRIESLASADVPPV
jgi:NAD(P)-dependent dehydrogenase (short-subunit alcohol dehydrogenase family)